jgi:branched-subunit amino acid transport protein
MTLWIAVLLAGTISLAFRALPVLAVQRTGMRPATAEALRHAGTGAVTGLVVLAVMHPVGVPGIDGTVLLAVVVAALLTWRGRSMAVAVFTGGAVYTLAVVVSTLC